MTIKRNRKWGMWGFVVFLGSMILILSISELIMKTIIEDGVDNKINFMLIFSFALRIIFGIILIVISYFGSKKYDTECKKLEEEIEILKKKSNIIDKKFSFYCPNCLYQSNSKGSICPKCNKGNLKKTNNLDN